MLLTSSIRVWALSIEEDPSISLASEPGGGVLRDKLCLLTNSSFDSVGSKARFGSVSDWAKDVEVEEDPIRIGDDVCSDIKLKFKYLHNFHSHKDFSNLSQ